MAAVELQNVSKIYSRVTGRKLLRSHVSHWFTRRLRPHREPFHALRNVSFRVGHGECVGVVGPNGAGKSTLLSLVAGLSFPDEGRVLTEGRVAALLELGSGFHPDLTGTENVYLNAALLGLTRQRTEELYDEIVEFSGIGDFIDEPLRTYSTGMVVRLAFSVAVNIDPDVLILDEVLAVGDRNFQNKCFDKVMQFRHADKTMLVVSHSAQHLTQMCDRAVWLDQGQLIMDGAVEEVLDAYAGRAAHAANRPR